MNVTLPNTAAIYVPSTMFNRPADNETIVRMLDFVMNEMISLHGGCTVTDAIGGYKSSTGELIKENIKIVKSAAETINVDAVFKLARTICQEMNQECVGVEINGVFNLVYPMALAA